MDEVKHSNENKKQRNGAFELLRILCMLLIISTHFSGHGGWIDNTSGYSKVIVKILHSLFLPSVNLFVMISAYFSCMRTDIVGTVKKIGKLYAQVWFYNILLFAIFCGFNLIEFNTPWLIDTILPLSRGKYWFFSSYIFMLLAAPFLNILIANMSRKAHFILCVIIAVLSINQNFVFSLMLPLSNGYSGMWFCMLYIIMAYVRKYENQIVLSPQQNKIAIVISSILYVGVLVLGYFVSLYHNDLPTLFASLYIFFMTKKIKITSPKTVRAICRISSLTFGIYLIHDSPEMRAYMYQNIFFSYKFYQSEFAALILIGFILTTFVACAIVEYLRVKLFALFNLCYRKTLKGKLHTPKFLLSFTQTFNNYFSADCAPPRNDKQTCAKTLNALENEPVCADVTDADKTQPNGSQTNTDDNSENQK